MFSIPKGIAGFDAGNKDQTDNLNDFLSGFGLDFENDKNKKNKMTSTSCDLKK